MYLFTNIFSTTNNLTQNYTIVKRDSTHTIGVEFGSKIIELGGKTAKLQVWDTGLFVYKIIISMTIHLQINIISGSRKI